MDNPIRPKPRRLTCGPLRPNRAVGRDIIVAGFDADKERFKGYEN